MKTMEVKEITKVDDRLLAGIEKLLPQLSPRLTAADRTTLCRMIANPCARLFVVEGDEGLLGMLSLVWYDVPSGRKAWIEDVVTDERSRGRGVGRCLVRHAVEYAARIGARKVMLTSSPHRQAAHALYLSENFEAAATTVFARKNE